jgi:hypothetical protein
MVDRVRNRLIQFCREVDEAYGNGDYGLDTGRIAERVWSFWRREKGYQLPDPSEGLEMWMTGAGPDQMRKIVQGAYLILKGLPRQNVRCEWFEHNVNAALRDGNISLRLVDGTWKCSAESEADDLLRQVLLDRSDVAGCQRGDVQVEMVASSAQVMLGGGATVVDYGAGLGRVGDGLSTAREFAFARYLAVDSPITAALRAHVASFGENCATMEREEFLRGAVRADVVLVVNTLHHVPFADIPRQFVALLRSLQSRGILVVHEMGAVEPPEQRNLPWTHDRITSLLRCEGLRVNARETRSKGKGIPLAHVIVSVEGSLDGIEQQLAERSRGVWQEMKRTTVDQIAELYARGNPDAVPDLRRAMIHNANLDLNPPPT